MTIRMARLRARDLAMLFSLSVLKPVSLWSQNPLSRTICATDKRNHNHEHLSSGKKPIDLGIRLPPNNPIAFTSQYYRVHLTMMIPDVKG